MTYIGIFLYMFAVFISSCSQILLKKSSNIQYSSKIKEYLNWHVIIAYGIFFSATLLNVFAYKTISISTGALLETTGYIYTLIFSKIFFKEKITKNKIIGMTFIFAGIFLLFI